VANKCDLFIQRDLVQAQAKYVEDVLEYLVTKETREAIFSIEPKQEFGLRTIVESQENVITYVKPWGEKEFGPWPENAEETNLEPRTYSLGDQGKDWFQFYKDISYYYPEQLLKAVRKVDKTLLYTISVSGLEQANINTIGFDQRAWHHWAYLPSLAKLGASDMRVYGDIHIYNHNVDNGRTASEYPEQIGIVIDRALASHGIIENLHKEDHYTKTSDWRFENIKIPLVIGEWGARLPRHSKPSGELLTPTIEDVKIMVTEFTSHIEKRGISGWCYWMYDNSFCLNPEENHASFYTPVEFPELIESLEANELKVQTGIEDTKVNDTGLVVFPNPVVDVLHIETSSEIQALQIYMITGQKLKEITMDSSKNAIIDVSDFEPTIYIVEIITLDGVFSIRFVKK
jgi:hypothetical protein